MDKQNHQEHEANFFDELKTGLDPAEALKQLEESKAKSERLDFLIHRTFEQHAPGKELLGMWKEALIMQPTAEGGMDKIEIGTREGQKGFVRAIILTVKKVEKGE
jgi:hypothetical protein